MGTSVLQKLDDWEGRWYGKRISPIFAGHAMMGKTGPGNSEEPGQHGQRASS